jgi:hypothetical protein
MLVLGVVAIGLGVGSSALAQDLRRKKESELLHAGDQFRRAIESCHSLNNVGKQPWPTSLEALLRASNQPGLVRHLRRIHVDPIQPGGRMGTDHEPGSRHHRGALGLEPAVTGNALGQLAALNTRRIRRWHSRRPAWPAPLAACRSALVVRTAMPEIQQQTGPI